MNLYSMVGTGNGTPEAAALSDRLVTWHDAMVAHERKVRARRADELCDEDCPHAQARALWFEALEVFGNRAQELTFLRSRALGSEPSQKLVASGNVEAGAGDRDRRSTGSGHEADARRPELFVGRAERLRTTAAEL